MKTEELKKIVKKRLNQIIIKTRLNEIKKA